MQSFLLAQETLGYQTSDDPSNSDFQLLVAGSQNVLIDYQKKALSRPGYTRLGAANIALTEIRNAWTWDSSTGFKLPQRFYDDELEVYLRTVDGVAINAWTRISMGWSTTKKLRYAFWYDATEKIDLQIMCQGDANLYEFGGGVAIVASATADTITKAGTTTFGQNRFYASRDLSLVCVRTGTVYTYTAGVGTQTLTGVVGDTSTLVAGDILVQSIVTQSAKPDANHTNDIIFVWQNQLVSVSYADELAYLSKNTSYFDFAFSSPRVPGEGALLTLTDPGRAINQLGDLLLIFCGQSTIFKVAPNQVAVGNLLTEDLKIDKLNVGIDQGALNHECVVPIGNILAYLTNEVALRTIEDPNNLTGINPKTLSNPIKPDFDNETWNPENTYGAWYKNTLIYTAGDTSHMYMLNYVQDADGNLFRFWNPPQILPVGPMSDIDSGNGSMLHGHSNAVPESYLLFDGLSDGQYPDMDPADKFPIHAIAAYAYDDNILIRRKFVKATSTLKNFDEYYVDGEITPNTVDLLLDLNYDFGGATFQLEETIDGSDEGLLLGNVGFNSLAQKSLGTDSLGGLINPPSNARKFHVVFEEAKEDYNQLQAIFSTNDVDRYWAITRHGGNTTTSTRKDTSVIR